MIKKISFNNYKNLDEKSFDFNKINVLTGFNGRGKSSVLQFLLMLGQSSREPYGLSNLHLNGHFVEMGEFIDIVTMNNLEKNFVEADIYVDNAKKETKVLHVHYEAKQNDPMTGELTKCFCDGNDLLNNRPQFNDDVKDALSESNYIKDLGDFVDFSKELEANKNISIDLPSDISSNFSYDRYHYISADRIGPLMYVNRYEVPSRQKVTSNGEDVYNVLQNYQTPVHRNRYIFSTDKEWIPLKEIANYWLDYIMSGGHLQIDENVPSPILIPKVTTPWVSKNYSFKLPHVGFGYGYIESVVVASLIAEPGDFLFVENPEAHLHPEAQARITHLLVNAAANGVQVFLETHSDHVLNAIRLAILRQDVFIEKEDVCIYFFAQDGNISKLRVKEDGKFYPWPKGFFTQYQTDVLKLIKTVTRDASI